MAFKVKGSKNILKTLIARVSYNTEKITDFNVGSAARTLLESVALQIEEFYYDMQNAVIYAIRNSGYHAFGFYKTPATRARGYVTIFFDEALRDPMTIQKGTRFHTGDNRMKRTFYRAVENVKIEAGSQAGIILIECEEMGKRGNAVAGEICKLAVGKANVFAVANTEDIVTGKDEETDDHRAQRFKEYVHTLQRGTKEAVEYGIKQAPGVSGVYVDDTHIGFMIAYVHDRNGNLNDDLKRAAQYAAYQYRSGGIEVEIRPIVKKVVDVTARVFYRPEVNETLYDALIAAAIERYIDNMRASQNLNYSSLVAYLYDLYEESIEYLRFENDEDVMTLPCELLRPGQINVNEENNIVMEGY